MARRSRKKKDNSWIFISIALLLLLIAILIRYNGSTESYTLRTSPYSANLLGNVPDLNAALLKMFRENFSIYLHDYIIPVFFFLIPAIILFAVGLSVKGGVKLKFIEALEDRKTEHKFMWALFLFTLILELIIWFSVTDNHPPSHRRRTFL